MHGISIRYRYDGEEERWEAAIAAFIASIDDDAELKGKFHYRVNKGNDGKTRVHWGWWDRPETVKALQSRDYFRAFSAAIQAMAGDSLNPVPLTEHLSTAR